MTFLIGSTGSDFIHVNGDGLIAPAGFIDNPNASAFGDDIFAGDGNDIIYAGGGDDLVSGGTGNDVIYGGAGPDTLGGGLGNDVFAYLAVTDSQGANADLIDLFVSGTDSIYLQSVVPSAVGIVRSGSSSSVFVTTAAGNMLIDVQGDPVQGFDIVSGGIGVTLQGDANANILLGSAANDTLFGNAGNDILSGGLGRDVLFGGAGADTFSFAASSQSNAANPDLIADFSAGADRLDLSTAGATAISIVNQGSSSLVFANSAAGQFQIGSLGTIQASDISTGGIGVVVQGDGASTQLNGTSFADTIFGGGGNDLLVGLAGQDVLFGGTGADIFRYLSATDSNAAAPDLIADFQTGLDKIDFTGTGVTAVGIAGNIVFGTGPNGISMQIGSLQPIALADIIIGGSAPAPLIADPVSYTTHGMDGAMF